MLKALAALVALALLGAAAHAIIVHTDGYGSPHSFIVLALAAGVAVGALTIGAAWTQGRRALAAAICIALVAGEAFGLISTAERLVTLRDRAQSPIKEAIAQREAARQRIADAVAAADKASTSARLTAATAAKFAADSAAVSKAAERGCASNCRALLEQQVSEATRELDAARAEVASRHAAALAAVAAQRAQFEALKLPPSPTPLADRLGLPGWSLDLLVAGLGSIAANGLAAALLVFAGHGSGTPRRNRETTSSRTTGPAQRHGATIDAVAEPVGLEVANVSEHAARFGIECLAPVPGAHAPLDAIKATYLAWCAAHNVAPLPDARISRALADLFGRVGLCVAEVDGRLAVIGAAIKPTTALVKIR